MRRLLLAAVAAAAIATPAMARDNSAYVGIEAGVMAPRDTAIDTTNFFPTTTTPSGTSRFDDAADIDYDLGFDGDLIAGYDFGPFKAEVELGYKRASIDHLSIDGPWLFAINSVLNVTPDITDPEFDIGGSASVVSGMVNGLFDFSDEAGWGGYFGAGIGLAGVRLLGDSDSALAFQGIAGVHMPIGENLDVGLKYRHMVVPNLSFHGEDNAPPGGYDIDGDFKSNSLLLSLIYNFAAPPPPPPPPATQTCPDGSVILATDTCPAPPPPPPPPPPAPERGF